MSFESFGLHANLLQGVKDLGFTQPSPIQKEAIPHGMAGKDLLACAATGSGKTAAFGLPLLHRLIDRKRGRTRALIVTPTRELALQIETHLRELGKHTPVRCASVYGGVGFQPQRKALQNGTDVIVATPGRLMDHMRQGTAKLDSVEVLVLDEADRMLDMGFLPDVRRILQSLPKDRQTFLFSATMPSEIAALSREMMREPVQINLKTQGKPAPKIAQSIYAVQNSKKQPLLLTLVQTESVRSALVFTRTKRRADRVAKFLAGQGVKTARIHGDRTQAQRNQALDGFKSGRYKVLVATDVAARGIDVQDLSHVINFDLPGSSEDYVHRIGRTARADASGEAFTFVTPEDEGDLRAIERRLALRLPRAQMPELARVREGFAHTAESEDAPHAQSGPKHKPFYERRDRNGQRHGHRHDQRHGHGNGHAHRGPRHEDGARRWTNNNPGGSDWTERAERTERSNHGGHSSQAGHAGQGSNHPGQNRDGAKRKRYRGRREKGQVAYAFAGRRGN
ncbi:MAG: DEAD/DEAH box helicase [Planctomycetes bacterium]|nr:DEAD/DEAH box helicase [Planctomycetota bacterium]